MFFFFFGFLFPPIPMFLQMWEELPFNKTGVAIMVFGSLFAGVGAILFSCHHQQKKHGYKK